MTQREKKEALKHRLNLYRDLELERAQVRQELDRVEASMDGPGGSNMDGMPRGSGTGDPVLAIVSQHMELKDKYLQLLGELSRAQAEIEDLINVLPPRDRVLMRLRYIQGLQWEEVCLAVGYSWRQTHRTHSKALDTILKAQDRRKEN